LCTKNNPQDIADAFDHPSMVLKRDRFVASRVNWDDKVSNLRQIAEELGIGLESLIFLDDNPVEVEAVRTRLPMVRTIQVPTELSAYPRVMDEIAALYLGGGISDFSRSKTEQYHQRAAASRAKAEFTSQEDYLASLDIEVALHVDQATEARRISELSMKSNQFNVTTLRQSEAQIAAKMADLQSEVISLTVSNKFGNAGLTGVLLLRFDRDTTIVENFFMSCRVLGQGVELALWPQIIERSRERGCRRITATFIPSAKNAQAAEFFDSVGFTKVGDDNGTKRYVLAIDWSAGPSPAWIKVS
jgi:FkbH-like protein